METYETQNFKILVRFQFSIYKSNITNIFLKSPLDQFIIKVGLCSEDVVWWMGWPTTLTTFSLQCLCLIIILNLYISYINCRYSVMSTSYLIINGLAKIINFIKILVTEQIQTRALFPLGSSLFIIIISSNIIGMVPYTLTTTSHIVMTLLLALITFITINLLYIINKKIQSAEIFLPTGTPLFITPFLIQIEIISYISRVISLSVRLFANMTSGHTLIKILSGFCTNLMASGILGISISIVIIGVIFAVSGLEIVIAILQTYVFVILICIYLHELEAGH